MLRKGDNFEHLFTQPGNYEVKCANYTQIKGLVQVVEEEQDFTLAKFKESYGNRELLLKSSAELDELIRPKVKTSPQKHNKSLDS